MIVDPTNLPYYLSVAIASDLTGLSAKTLRGMVRSGDFKQAVHYVKPGGTGRVRFLREGMLAWMNGSAGEPAQSDPRQSPKVRAGCRGNLNRSPELAAVLADGM